MPINTQGCSQYHTRNNQYITSTFLDELLEFELDEPSEDLLSDLPVCVLDPDLEDEEGLAG